MKCVDFSECDFIDKQMKFYTYNDFYNECRLIKAKFDELSKDGKRFFMWYLYANTHMTLRYKNVIWDYLNEFKNEDDLDYFKRFYGA